jgi:hypothetical protein
MLVEVYDDYPEDGEATVRPALLDLGSDRVTVLGANHSAWERLRTASRGAFSPDGQRIVLTEGGTVRLLDRTGRVVWSTELEGNRYLAGAGAFSPDGTRIAIADLNGCLTECDRDALAAREWSFSYLDAATGRPAAGPRLPVVTGSAVRALGWSRGRDLVVLRHQPEDDAYRASDDEYWNDTGWEETGHITLLALEPGGGTRTLLDPPDGVLTMDVARDLLEAGRFGGPTPRAAPFPARGVIGVALVPIVALTLGAAGLVLLVVRRVRRRS